MLPAVAFEIDGHRVEARDWLLTLTAGGGFERASAEIREDDVRRWAVAQGSILRAHAEGRILWEGRAVVDPHIVRGVARLDAVGEVERLRKRHGRLLYQSRDASLFTGRRDSPYNENFGEPDKINYEVHQGGLLWMLQNGTALVSGEAYGGHWSAPGTPGGITRVKFDWRSRNATTVVRFDHWQTTYPAVAADYAYIGGSTVNATSGTVAAFPTPNGKNDDYLLLFFVVSNVTPNAYWIQVYNFRINGIVGDTDTYRADQVVTDIAGRLGFDTSEVAATVDNVLPFDHTPDRSWADAIAYMAELEDRPWLVLDGPRLTFGDWGARTHRIAQARDAAADLVPLEKFNRAVVSYADVGGGEREVTVTAASAGIADPLPDGLVNTITQRLDDVQPDATLATAVGRRLLERAATSRWAGSIAVPTYEILPGEEVVISDFGPGQATTHRVHEVELAPTGARLGIEAPASVASLLGWARIAGARSIGPPAPPADEPGPVFDPRQAALDRLAFLKQQKRRRRKGGK